MLAPEKIQASIPSQVGDASAFLLQSDKNGTNLYEHLTDVVLRLMEQRPSNSYDAFESISREVKLSKTFQRDDSGHQVIIYVIKFLQHKTGNR